jgi:hypothetical protein
MKDIEKEKFEERLQYALGLMNEVAKQYSMPMDKDLFIQAWETARMLFVRSEIAYSSKS